MKVAEIFLSIQGEGIDQGEPCIFIRTFGCNNNCKYCDTKYARAGSGYMEMNAQKIVEKIQKLGYKNICLTGGEPLLWKEAYLLVKKLKEAGYTIWIETNGTLPIDDFIYSKNIRIVMDIKCPSSDMQKNTRWENLKLLRSGDQVKFVVATEADYNFAKKVIFKFSHCQAKFLISPVFRQDDFEPEWTPAKIIKKVLCDRLPVRISLQLQKFIWHSESEEIS